MPIPIRFHNEIEWMPLNGWIFSSLIVTAYQIGSSQKWTILVCLSSILMKLKDALSRIVYSIIVCPLLITWMIMCQKSIALLAKLPGSLLFLFFFFLKRGRAPGIAAKINPWSGDCCKPVALTHCVDGGVLVDSVFVNKMITESISHEIYRGPLPHPMHTLSFDQSEDCSY